jgi:hypothetical protein
MYVAPSSDKDWLLSEQRKLYARSYENPDYVFRKLWGLMTDPRNRRLVWCSRREVDTSRNWKFPWDRVRKHQQ